ncbi:hypothetical protein [Nostoc sp.]|uniref:hypothetical protein n=1 Tax=Nostoc sp. TaxID=1180 RepID=UPI002FF585FD
MSQFIQPIKLQISPDSLNQGEEAILQELALQLYASVKNFIRGDIKLCKLSQST